MHASLCMHEKRAGQTRVQRHLARHRQFVLAAARNRSNPRRLSQGVQPRWQHVQSILTGESMRIAQVAPLAESVPPKLYGGTERVVAWLVDELVELGHEVTLFASGDSKSSAKLHAVWPQALRLGGPRTDPMAAQAALLEAVAG